LIINRFIGYMGRLLLALYPREC